MLQKTHQLTQITSVHFTHLCCYLWIYSGTCWDSQNWTQMAWNILIVFTGLTVSVFFCRISLYVVRQQLLSRLSESHGPLDQRTLKFMDMNFILCCFTDRWMKALKQLFVYYIRIEDHTHYKIRRKLCKTLKKDVSSSLNTLFVLNVDLKMYQHIPTNVYYQYSSISSLISVYIYSDVF